MRPLLCRLALLVCLGCAAFGAVVNPAPDFSWDSAGGKVSTLKGLRGSCVLLLVARSPKDKAFVEQVRRMKPLYQEFAARKVVCAAAFFEDAGARIPSDIPFLVVGNGPQLIADYGVKDHFNVIAIGPDGNIDLQTGNVLPASRLRDMAINTFGVQSDERR